MPKAKLVSILCESMQWCDVKGQGISCLTKKKFNTSPSRFSAQSLWLMQSEDPKLVSIDDCHNTKRERIFDKGDFLSTQFKTRLIAHWFPHVFNPARLDPLADSPKNGFPPVFREPNSWQYPVLLKFLKQEFFNSDYQWLIYWPSIGHVECSDCRLPPEDKGVPDNIHQTTAEWFRLINKDILPFIKPDTTVFIHTDHGSARRIKNHNWNDGFLFHTPNVQFRDNSGWNDYRKMVRQVLS